MADSSDPSERFVAGISALQAVAVELLPEEALDLFDEATLQLFWREWPDVSSWAGTLWRQLNSDLAEPATPPTSDMHEIGGEG